MVVPLIWLGTATKLALALAVVYRRRTWWVPGAIALFLGALAALHPPTHVLGLGSMVLGASAIAITRWVRHERRPHLTLVP